MFFIQGVALVRYNFFDFKVLLSTKKTCITLPKKYLVVQKVGKIPCLEEKSYPRDIKWPVP